MTFSFEKYLDTFLDWEKRLAQASVTDFSLERVDRLLRAFGHPDDKLRFVHVAGSKGKGSTCVYLAHILRAAGYRVGLYTSPHLYALNERIRVLEPRPAGVSADPFEGAAPLEELGERARYYQEPVDRLRFEQSVGVTYFEYLTALAMSYFARRAVDVVVLETGLGGRLDATNVVETMVCGITPIGLEHTQVLGHSLTEIAVEKAGIIKSPSQKVVLAPQEAGVMDVLLARCRSLGIVPEVIGKDVGLAVRNVSQSGSSFDIVGRREYRGLETLLAGEHQAWNAALAVGMAEDLEMYGLLLSTEAVARGVAETVWPARFEIFSGSPAVVLDCAHTGESARVLAAVFARVFPNRRAVLVFGTGVDKDAAMIARELLPVADQVVLTKARHVRASEPGKLLSAGIFAPLRVCVAGDTVSALADARVLAGSGGIILVCGSVFVCAEARAVLSGRGGHVSV